MDATELTDALETAGLPPYEAAAYVALLELRTARATDIAEASDVPRPRIYDVLGSLADRGYVELYEEGTLRARAHSPANVLEDLRGQADTFEAAADEIEERWEQPELSSTDASVVGKLRTVIERARLFIDQADHHINLSITPENFDRLRDSLERAHERGVTVHAAIHTDTGTEPPAADRFAGACKEARHRALPAPFVALVDRRMTCFAPHPGSADQYGVLVNDQTYSFVFYWYFLTCSWMSWETIHSERRSKPPIEYIDLRRLVREIQPLVDAGATITVSVEGRDLESGDVREFDGTVSGTRYGAATEGADTPCAGVVTLLVDTGDGEVSVGAWGAVVEEVEATRIVVEAIDDADGDGPARVPAGNE